eukprot:2536896-Rhodomonas_salina.2
MAAVGLRLGKELAYVDSTTTVEAETDSQMCTTSNVRKNKRESKYGNTRRTRLAGVNTATYAVDTTKTYREIAYEQARARHDQHYHGTVRPTSRPAALTPRKWQKAKRQRQQPSASATSSASTAGYWYGGHFYYPPRAATATMPVVVAAKAATKKTKALGAQQRVI